MKNLILIVLLTTALLSCSTEKNSNNETNSSWTTTNETTQTISWTITNEATQTQEIVSETWTITTTWEVILPVNEMTTQAEKELSDELNNILESIESTWSVK